MIRPNSISFAILLLLLIGQNSFAQKPLARDKDIRKTQDEWLQTLPEKVRDSIVYKEWKESLIAQDKKATEDARAKIEKALADPNSTYLDLSYYPHAEIDPRIATLKNLREINISKSPKLDLAKLFDLLAKLPNLQMLYLSGGNYNILPSNVSNLTNLQWLELRNNNFKTLPESFSKLQKLTYLNLGHNAYLYDDDVYARLQSMNVSSLVLSACGYSEINDKIGSVRTLKVLDLSVNDIKTLPASFNYLSKLESVDLSQNTNLNMVAVCNTLAALPDLSTLHLDQCYLSTLPVEIGNLKSLKVLTANENVITSLPATLSNLSLLEELRVSSPNNAFRMNAIQTLPPGFGKLSKLRILDLAGNQLTSLGADFDQLRNLEWIDLSRNQLSLLPRSLTRLSKLRIINLNRNKISEISNGLGELLALDSLFLDGDFFNKADMKIRVLPTDICSLKDLKKLTLKDNVIENLPECFGGLNSLVSLDLRGNVLTALPASFTKLTRLQVLDLKTNDLSGLPEGFADLHSLSELNIAMNINADFNTIIPMISKMKTLKIVDISYNNLTRAQAQPLIDALPGCKILNIDYYNKAPLPTNTVPTKGTNYDDIPKRNMK